MRALALCVLVAAPAARAEPTSYVEGGLMFGAAEPVIGWNIMPTIDGGYRLGDVLWLHGGVGFGGTIDNLGSHAPNSGSNGLVRGGIETRWCGGPHHLLCAAGGLDLGASHGTWAPTASMAYSHAYGPVDSMTSTALLAIPRAGFDIGGDSVRARIGVEADLAVLERTTSQLAGAEMTESRPGFVGIELAAGVAYQW
jgi:hypothetical protein